MKSIIRIFAAVMLLAGVAFADYHYASHEGSDEYPYTFWETAADSIQKAIDASSPGDTVYVGVGTFLENIVMIDSIGLIGMGMDNTTIEGTAPPGPNVVVVRGRPGILVQDLHIKGPGQAESYKGIETYDDFLLRMRNCKISDCYWGISSGGDGVLEAANNVFAHNNRNIYILFRGDYLPLIANNTFGSTEHPNVDIVPATVVNNYFEGSVSFSLSINWGGAWPNMSPRVANNLFARNGNEHDIIDFFYITKAVCENNTIVGGFDLIYQGAWYRDTLIVSNNILSGATGIAAVRIHNGNEWSVAKIHYNDLWNNATDFYFWDSVEVDTIGNIRADPMFYDTTDFWLQAFSPCIDAGDPEIFDVDGSRSDIGYTGGPGGISYEYADLPPSIPDSFTVSVMDDTIRIVWPYATEADFSRYNIYRSNESGFTPSVENLYAAIDTSVFKDADWYNDRNYYYLITAVDNQDNESDPSVEIPVIFVGIGDIPPPSLPKAVTLYQNYPNPFNPKTTIKYYLPDVGAQPAEVRIVIYDLLGKEVKTLVNKKEYPGEHTVTWDGRDNSGRELSSGVYFYRLFWWGREFTKAKRMVLIK